MKKRFSVTFVMELEENNNILSSDEFSHATDVQDLVLDTFYDTDDVSIENLYVKERQ
tara:strand:+ start:290 stop:460 length:171 start_codon:yes stop_codon:yes gene_type:complete